MLGVTLVGIVFGGVIFAIAFCNSDLACEIGGRRESFLEEDFGSGLESA